MLESFNVPGNLLFVKDSLIQFVSYFTSKDFIRGYVFHNFFDFKNTRVV